MEPLTRSSAKKVQRDRSIAPIPLAFAVRFNCAAGRGPGVKSRR